MKMNKDERRQMIRKEIAYDLLKEGFEDYAETLELPLDSAEVMQKELMESARRLSLADPLGELAQMYSVLFSDMFTDIDHTELDSAISDALLIFCAHLLKTGVLRIGKISV
jgi:hypothetical protein